MHKILDIKAVRFIVSGGLAASSEYGLFIILQIQLDDTWIYFSQTVSFLVGFVVSFLLNKLWVFRSSGGSIQELYRYAIIAAINLAMGNFILWMFASVVGLNFFVAKIVVMISIAMWNYFIFQKIVFTEK